MTPSPERDVALCECGCGQPAPIAKGTDRRTGKEKGKPQRYVLGHRGRATRDEGWFKPNEMGGKCHCGCGESTVVATKTDRRNNRLRGEHVRFVLGHSSQLASGEEHPRWKGGRKVSDGYVLLWAPDHTRGPYVQEHILVVERAMGKPLNPKHPVHHVNKNRSDNRPENLVVCEDAAYHNLIHRRERALDECGHADWLRCGYCGKHDAPQNMYCFQWRGWEKAYHPACHARAGEIRRSRAAAEVES